MAPHDPEIQQLFKQGVAALQSGQLPKAERVFRRLTGKAPDHAVSHDFLARICLQQSRVKEAERYAGLALAHGRGAPRFQDTLIEIMIGDGRAEKALAELRKAAEVKPDDFGTAYSLGILLARLGQGEAGMAWLLRARQISDRYPWLRFKIILLLIDMGKYREALEAIEAALTLGDKHDDLHTLAGNCHHQLANYRKAAEAFQRGIRQNSKIRENHVGLSAALAEAGQRKVAAQVSTNFVERFPYWRSTPRAPEARILVLGGVGIGYFDKLRTGEAIYTRGNTINQVNKDRFDFRYLLVDHPDPASVALSYGPVDAIFNNAANAEIAEEKGYTAKIRKLVDAMGAPVINSPEAVARTSRLNNAEIIPRETDIVFPRTLPFRVTKEGIAASAAEIMAAFDFPFILRRTKSHHDTNVFLVNSEAELANALRIYCKSGASDVYAIEYLTEEFLPGVFRKIRCALIDGEVCLNHVDFSPNWNVHRTRQDKMEIEFMQSNQHLMDQELAFLRDPEGCLGEQNMRRLRDLARVLEMDFVGIDFNILSNGDLVVFEANASMSTITPHKVKTFPYFADYWQRAQVSFENMLLRKAGKL